VAERDTQSTIELSLVSIRPDEDIEDLILDTPVPADGWGGPVVEAPSPGLELGPELGRGGSAVVRLARQRSLGREVAVKAVRPDLDGAGLRNILLREARVTGALERPGAAT